MHTVGTCETDGLAVGDAVVGDAVVGDAVVGDAVVGNIVVGDAVVGDAVVGNAVVGDAVVGNAVVGDAVVGDAVVGDAVVEALALPILPAFVVTTVGSFVFDDFEAHASGDLSRVIAIAMQTLRMIPIFIIFVPDNGKEKQELELDEVKSKIYDFLLSQEDICQLSQLCQSSFLQFHGCSCLLL
jgi:hypothetical protein